jgi:hypothetical protein
MTSPLAYIPALILIALCLLVLCSGALCDSAPQTLILRYFRPETLLTRAERPLAVRAVVDNVGEADAQVAFALQVPEQVRLLAGDATGTVTVPAGQTAELHWQVQAAVPLYGEVSLTLKVGETQVVAQALPVRFLEPLPVTHPGYIPEPQPVRSKILVGAHNCPLWEADKPQMWTQILKHPERTPALGFYDQANPEVADWETKWASEHGVDYFIYCWYRAEQGGAVKMRFGSAIHDALFKSRFADKMKFTIMWENQSRGVAGVADENDLMQNLLPFWIENYFKHPSYVKIDNKPLLYIYRPEFLVQDLGGVDKVRQAFDKMRQACKDAGFDGLYILGEYRGLDPKHLQLMKDLGLDYTFAYCWGVPNSPTPQQAIDAQMNYIHKTQELGILPQVVTVSQAWSGWRDEGSIWKIPPQDFERLLSQAKDFISTLPADQLGSKMLLLDNWNEWGEGHYIAPYTEYGFGYLDAVRKVIHGNTQPHVDLIPSDIGMGPYDRAYWDAQEKSWALRKLVNKRVLKGGAPLDGLVAWWAFDEDTDSPITLDYYGNRLGGVLSKCKRAPGIDGNALVCDGGWVTVEPDPRLSVTAALSIECWVKTDQAGQDNRWMVNRVLSGGTNTGFRLGLAKGAPSFEVPVTDFSHHLNAEQPLPLGRWVHLAGTFDGKVMRLYVDGQLVGTMDRPGPARGSNLPLYLGSYAPDHWAHFDGLLDEVRLWSRALTPEEIAAHAKPLAN